MLKIMALAAGLTVLGLAAPASAAPLAGARDNPAAGEGIIEKVYTYRRDCYWTGTGWGYKKGTAVLVCRPYRPAGRGWVWYSDGGRHGWYHQSRKSWHYNKW